MTTRLLLSAVALTIACTGDSRAVRPDAEQARQSILAANEKMVAAMIAGSSTAEYHTPDWQGVNLNGTPMSAQGFQGEERSMQYDKIEFLDREVRVYGETAALRWHANFHVRVNGEPSFAEMRLLDVYVWRDGGWLLDLTQVTPVYGTVGNPPGD